MSHTEEITGSITGVIAYVFLEVEFDWNNELLEMLLTFLAGGIGALGALVVKVVWKRFVKK